MSAEIFPILDCIIARDSSNRTSDGRMGYDVTFWGEGENDNSKSHIKPSTLITRSNALVFPDKEKNDQT